MSNSEKKPVDNFIEEYPRITIPTEVYYYDSEGDDEPEIIPVEKVNAFKLEIFTKIQALVSEHETTFSGMKNVKIGAVCYDTLGLTFQYPFSFADHIVTVSRAVLEIDKHEFSSLANMYTFIKSNFSKVLQVHARKRGYDFNKKGCGVTPDRHFVKTSKLSPEIIAILHNHYVEKEQ